MRTFLIRHEERPSRFAVLLVTVGLASVNPLRMPAQMVSPSIDQPGQPFSYFSKPTDEIGVMGAEAATEITPEGYLRTGFAELMFFSGPGMEPTTVRIRTLEQGHLPIVHYEFTRDGIDYRVTVFEAPLDESAIDRLRQRMNSSPDSSAAVASSAAPLVNFIRVAMKNQSREPTRAIFATGIRYDGPNTTGAPHGDNRFTRPVEGRFPGDYRQVGEAFDPNWTNSFDGSHFYRSGRELYAFPDNFVSREFLLREVDTGRQMPDLTQPVKLNANRDDPRRHRHLLQPSSARRRVDARLQDAARSHCRCGHHQRHRPSQL